MDVAIPPEILERLTTFGELLRYLRRRAGLTQTSLSIAVGYSDAQISRLEQNLRLPNLATVQARFLPVLRLKNEPAARDRLLKLGQQAQQQRADIQLGAEGRAGQRMPSIAVLPFINIGPAAENLAWHYQFARQFEQAVEQCWKTSELHPNSFWPAYFFGLAYEQLGQIDRAVEELQVAVTMSGEVTFASAALGHLPAPHASMCLHTISPRYVRDWDGQTKRWDTWLSPTRSGQDG